MTESAQPPFYPIVTFGCNHSTDPRISTLFKNLNALQPMDKGGPMSGRCGPQTDQMEHFLTDTFDFKNIPGEYIVQGVRSFQLGRPPHSMDPGTLIYFPSNTDSSFVMTVQEIINWQRSYQVYADANIEGMSKDFLDRALRGQSQDGEEAFRMKFVVRISTCPIFMEFDAKIIPRSLEEDWPNRIKLVSVTGIDFAGRKHDVGDIVYHISNWRAVFTVDPESDLPLVYGGRDFHSKSNRPRTKLRKQRVWNSLLRMARLRLRACDTEGIQIVVETGIGLGVFSGNGIGIDKKIRTFSAKAIRQVLEEDGASYNHIQAVVFALPIFNKDRSKYSIPDPFDDFKREFRNSKYNGPIPVLIADQDMHRLTVAIARYGFIVSELNPADSHGVFGEYWQNRGPAVEEKLALTTLGLLVQHHLINFEVLNIDRYHLVALDKTSPLNYHIALSEDDRKSMCRCFPIR